VTTNPNVVESASPRVASSTPPRPRTPRSAAPARAAATPARRGSQEKPKRAAPRPPAQPSDALITALRWVDKQNGSDLHLAANSRPIARIDGSLTPVDGAASWDAAFVQAAIRSLMTDGQWTTFERELESNFAVALPGLRYRATVYRQRGSVGAALRRIPERIRSLRELALPEHLASLAELPRGLVLVTGRTGSGKSSTLAALVDRINRTRAVHIITIEDPIEFVHTADRALINQREVGSDTADYPTALRQVLRQDPDVVLLGELRDRETISGALSAAETGHLVLATLHTQSAPQTIDRIVDVFPAHQQDQVRAQLALTLKAVVSQELLPRAAGRGRVVAAEVMIGTPAVGNLIREGMHHQIPSLMMSGAELGMQSMDQALAELTLAGVISGESAFSVAHDRSVLIKMLQHLPTTWVPDLFAQPAGDLPRSA
jgi:twitching motility protein PilT